MPKFYKIYKYQELEEAEDNMNRLSANGWGIKEFFFQSKIEKYILLVEIESDKKPIEFEQANVERQGMQINTTGQIMGGVGFMQNNNFPYGGVPNPINFQQQNQSDGFHIYTGK